MTKIARVQLAPLFHLLALSLILSNPCSCLADQQEATLRDGSKVLLSPDGTWKPLENRDLSKVQPSDLYETEKFKATFQFQSGVIPNLGSVGQDAQRIQFRVTNKDPNKILHEHLSTSLFQVHDDLGNSYATEDRRRLSNGRYDGIYPGQSEEFFCPIFMKIVPKASFLKVNVSMNSLGWDQPPFEVVVPLNSKHLIEPTSKPSKFSVEGTRYKDANVSLDFALLSAKKIEIEISNVSENQLLRNINTHVYVQAQYLDHGTTEFTKGHFPNTTGFLVKDNFGNRLRIVSIEPNLTKSELRPGDRRRVTFSLKGTLLPSATALVFGADQRTLGNGYRFEVTLPLKTTAK